jgi:hypothetical protein
LEEVTFPPVQLSLDRLQLKGGYNWMSKDKMSKKQTAKMLSSSDPPDSPVPARDKYPRQVAGDVHMYVHRLG